MIRDLLRIPCLVNEESSLKSNTKSNHSSAFTTSSFDDSGATMPILHSIPASNTAVITEMQRALNGIESAYYLLLMTVNRSTDFTKSIHGIPLAPQWEFVNVGDVASKSIQIISYLQQDATIQLHQDFHGGLLTDQQWLLDNLLCLISNSVKYSTHCVDIQVFILKKSHKDSYDFISLQRNYAYFVHISEEMSGEEAMEWVHIEVWDRGKGLTTQNAINIFNAPDFSSQRPVGGSGLGLYCLGKRLDMLGGCYGVSPRPDTQPGSMFWILMPINSKVADLALFRRRKVILPNIKELTSLRDEEVKSAALNDSLRFKAKPPSAIEEVQLTNTTPNSQIPVGKAINVVAKQNLTVKANEEENMPRKDNLHILLVDDSLPILKMLRMMLERSGYHVESASDGYGALQQLFGEDVNLECDPDAVPPTATIHPSDRHKFDVVLMDLQMPEMDGFQAIRCIRQRENECIRRNGEAGNGKHHQLILAMSANSDANTRQEALQVGADCFIPKPFKMDMFYDALQSCWEQYDT